MHMPKAQHLHRVHSFGSSIAQNLHTSWMQCLCSSCDCWKLALQMIAKQVRASACFVAPCGSILTPLTALLCPAPTFQQHALATAGNKQEEEGRQQLAGVIENLTGQVHGFAEAGGHESERVIGLEHAARQIQETAAGLAQRQGTWAGARGERYESNSLLGKNVFPEGFTDKTSCKQWSRRYKLVAGATDEIFKVLLECARRPETKPTPSWTTLRGGTGLRHGGGPSSGSTHRLPMQLSIS